MELYAKTAWANLLQLAPRSRSSPRLPLSASYNPKPSPDPWADQSMCEILIHVRRGQKYEGPLTPWSPEEEMPWENLGRPHAATSLNIEHCVVLQRPVTFQRPQQWKIPVWCPTLPASNVVLRGFAPPDTNQLLDERANSRSTSRL